MDRSSYLARYRSWLWDQSLVGVEPDGFLEVGYGLIQSALGMQKHSRGCNGQRPFWGRAEWIAGVADGLVQPALSPRAIPRLLWASSHFRVEPNGFLVVADGLVQPALGAKTYPRLLWAVADTLGSSRMASW